MTFDDFDKQFNEQFEYIKAQQRSGMRLAKVGAVVAGFFAIAGGCFMCWMIYTLVTGLVK